MGLGGAGGIGGAAFTWVETYVTYYYVNGIAVPHNNYVTKVSPAGYPGSLGIPGINGISGFPGAAGIAGTDGLDGTNGSEGRSGVQGQKGIDGKVTWKTNQ